MLGNGHSRRLRIAQVAPLHESVPPRRYGGTERIVSYLTEELVREGHDVTLFATGDSRTTAHHVAPCARALRLEDCADPVAYHVLLVEDVMRRAQDYDILHFHIDYLHFPSVQRDRMPHITTLHGRLDLANVAAIFGSFPDMPLVSISNAQRAPLPGLRWQATVHHGVPADLYALSETPGDYVACLGRISPEKGIDAAIEIARRAGLRLKIAAKIDRADRDYYKAVIEPLLAQPHVEFLGEIDEAGKQELLGGARALLFPIDWPEPFGMVMVEAMACGTPVIAYPRGSVREVIDDGVTGFICAGIDDAVAAIGRLDELSRAGCRAVFERRFTADRMAAEYVQIYHQQLRGSRDARDRARPPGLLHPRDDYPRG
jgi:glycosyltransferase involved in cell wall biosynthesis